MSRTEGDTWFARMGWKAMDDLRSAERDGLVHALREKYKAVHGRGLYKKTRVWASVCGICSYTETFPPRFTEDPVTCMLCASTSS